MGIALDRGLIESLDTPVAQWLPGYTQANSDARRDRITLEHPLTMSDGLDWGEHVYSYSDPRNIVGLINRKS